VKPETRNFTSHSWCLIPQDTQNALMLYVLQASGRDYPHRVIWDCNRRSRLPVRKLCHREAEQVPLIPLVPLFVTGEATVDCNSTTEIY